MVAIAFIILTLILFSLPASALGIKLLLESFQPRQQPSSANAGLLSFSLLSTTLTTTLYCLCLDKFLRFAMNNTWQPGTSGEMSSPALLILALALLGTLPGVVILVFGFTYRMTRGSVMKLPLPSA